MVISSLFVETQPQATARVAEELAKLPGVEVHEVVEYKVVVSIEAGSVDESQEIANGFVTLPGVIGVNLVYVNFEEDPLIERARQMRR